MEDFDLQSVLSQIMGDEHDKQAMAGSSVEGQGVPVFTSEQKLISCGLVTDDAVRVVTAPTDTTVVTAEQSDEQEEPVAPPSTLVTFPKFTEEDLAETFDIRNYATLCKLKVRKWGGRVKDKSAARKAETDAGAVNGAFSTYKKLFAGVEDKLRAVNSVLDAARTRHYEMTMPWSVTGVDDRGRRDGPRLLANTLFMEYISEMGQAKQQMQAVLGELKKAYPSMIVEAKKNLGSGFDVKQYPTSEEIEDYFDLEFEFMPVPSGADYKGLPQQQVQALAGKLNKSMHQCMENALRDVWDRTYTVVHRMAERLSNPKHTFHDTLVSNVRELAALIAHLNPTNNPRIENIRKRMEDDLCRFDPDVLRKDLMKRALTARLAKDILDDMSNAGSKLSV